MPTSVFGPETWSTDRQKIEGIVAILNADDDELRYEIEERGKYVGIAVYDGADKIGNL